MAEVAGLSEKQWQQRTIHCVFLANDWECPQNEEVVEWYFNVADTREKHSGIKSEEMRAIAEDPTFPVQSLEKQSYADFIENGRRSDKARATIAIMTEMSETATMNAVYNRAKQHCLAVLMVLPPDSGHWCALLDIAGDPLKGGEEDYKVEDVFTEEVMTKIENNSCEVTFDKLKWWMHSTIISIGGRYMIPDFSALYHRKGLFRRHWCFSGIPSISVGYLDDFIGFIPVQSWRIEKCSVEGMSVAFFPSEQELILINLRPMTEGKTREIWPLNRISDRCVYFDLKETPLNMTVIDEDRVRWNVGDDVTFEKGRAHKGWLPIRNCPNPSLDLSKMRLVIMDSLKEVTKDELLESLVESAISSIYLTRTRDSMTSFSLDLTSGLFPKVNHTHAWIQVIQSLVNRNVQRDLSFVVPLLDEASQDENVDWKQSDWHWTAIFKESAIFDRVPNKSHLFSHCLYSVGIGMNKCDYSAVDWALDKGDSKLVDAAYSYEKSLNSQSTLEDDMAAKYARWSAQSSYFVKNYLMKEEGGKKAVKALSDALVKFIRDRGDFTDVDLMGLVWHSDDKTKRAVLKRLMMSVKNTLDYHTVHCDKTGWMWLNESVLKHPVWLSEQLKETKEDESDAGDSDSGDGKKTPILYALMKDHCEKESSDKGRNDIETEVGKLRENEPDEWKELTKYQPLIKASMKIRQDLVGRKPGISREEIHRISIRFNTVDFNAEKDYDSQAYVTGVLLDAHLVQPHFEDLMEEALSQYGRVQIAPVKKASRVIPKSEEYASKGRKWPHSACVIDLVRCSLTVKSIGQLLCALKGFEVFLAEHNAELSLVRCKNGFAKFDGTDSLPSHYCDVKMNVACKDESGSKCVIGEVQFLLDCILQSKKKGHELYEVTRMNPLYQGARRRFESEWSIQKQLMLAVDNFERLTRLLTFFPFQLCLDQIDFSLLWRSKWNNEHLIDRTADAIVFKSGVDSASKLHESMLNDLSLKVASKVLLPLGGVRLMCEVIQRAGKKDDCIRFVSELLESQSDIRCLVPALMGLDLAIKEKVKLPYLSYKSLWSSWGADFTALELVAVLQGWQECDSRNIANMARLLFWAISNHHRQVDDTLGKAVQGLFELDGEQLMDFFTTFLEKTYKSKVPGYLSAALKECRDTHPRLIQAFTDRGFVVTF